MFSFFLEIGNFLDNPFFLFWNSGVDNLSSIWANSQRIFAEDVKHDRRSETLPLRSKYRKFDSIGKGMCAPNTCKPMMLFGTNLSDWKLQSSVMNGWLMVFISSWLLMITATKMKKSVVLNWWNLVLGDIECLKNKFEIRKAHLKLDFKIWRKYSIKGWQKWYWNRLDNKKYNEM